MAMWSLFHTALHRLERESAQERMRDRGGFVRRSKEREWEECRYVGGERTGLKDLVGKPKHEQVLHHLLAEVVIDPIHLLLVEKLHEADSYVVCCVRIIVQSWECSTWCDIVVTRTLLSLRLSSAEDSASRPNGFSSTKRFQPFLLSPFSADREISITTRDREREKRWQPNTGSPRPPEWLKQRRQLVFVVRCTADGLGCVGVDRGRDGEVEQSVGAVARLLLVLLEQLVEIGKRLGLVVLAPVVHAPVQELPRARWWCRY